MPNEVNGAAGRRPVLHFTPQRGWINDPHGITFRSGEYHLFHQAVPDATVWRPQISWGHATSPDLLTWRQLPDAVSPGDGDDGCWSGSVCTTPADAPAVMYYTSVSASDVDQGCVRVARPVDDEWLTWRKGEVVVPTADQPPVRVFRDPNVFWDGDCWRMLVGAGYPDGRAAVLCYRSTDQEQWIPEGPLVESEPPEAYGVASIAWECPQIVRAGDRDVLLVSVLADGQGEEVLAAVGSYRAGRMRVEEWSRLTHGGGHYAPTTFLDAEGAPCVLFWIRGIADPDAGWSGALSIPYRLSVVDGRVAVAPHPAVAAARPGTGGTLGFTWRPGQAGDAALAVPAADGGTAVDLAVSGGTLTVRTAAGRVSAPTSGGDVQVVVDGPVLEVATSSTVIGMPVWSGSGVHAPATPVHLWWA